MQKKKKKKVTYKVYLHTICQIPIWHVSLKGSKIHNWVTLVWLVKNYIHFSYPKCGKVVTGSEIGKFGNEDEKCVLERVTNMLLICDQKIIFQVFAIADRKFDGDSMSPFSSHENDSTKSYGHFSRDSFHLA